MSIQKKDCQNAAKEIEPRIKVYYCGEEDEYTFYVKMRAWWKLWLGWHWDFVIGANDYSMGLSFSRSLVNKPDYENFGGTL